MLNLRGNIAAAALFCLELSLNKSLDYSNDITECVLREKCTREPLPLCCECCILLCFYVSPERCSFKHKSYFQAAMNSEELP